MIPHVVSRVTVNRKSNVPAAAFVSHAHVHGGAVYLRFFISHEL